MHRAGHSIAVQRILEKITVFVRASSGSSLLAYQINDLLNTDHRKIQET
jgi:hypothetical protein